MKKRILSMIMIATMGLSAAACGKETAETASTEEASTLFESTTSEAPAADSASAAESEAATSEEAQANQAEVDFNTPDEYATDGVWSAYLLASDADKSGTTDADGTTYAIIYSAEATADEIVVYGAMNFRNSKDQDPIAITENTSHMFKVDSSTKYQMTGGEAGPDDVSKDEFFEYITSLIDSGLGFEVEVVNGVAVTMQIQS